MPERHVVLRHREIPDLHTLDVYRRHGGYAQFERVVRELQPAEVTAIVKESSLRGRGGAGFPTGLKWSFVPAVDKPKYIVVNNDESEPGTFKDHEITLQNPHQFIEGALIAAYAIGAEAVYIYCRGEFWQEMAHLERCIEAARGAGLIGRDLFGSEFGCEVYVTPGAGAYICGEETALLNSLEGELGQPRLKPPFPAAEGLYACPTVVNNTETLANVPWILEHGADAYRAIGTERSPGTKVISVCGHVERPGNYELPLGTPFAEVLEIAGGVWKGRTLKALLPAGASAPIIPGDVAMTMNCDWEAVASVGSILGSASFIVLDETTDMVELAARTTRFFEHESCGKCSPCREGTYWMKGLYDRMMRGDGRPDDVQILADVVESIDGKCFCPLGEFALSTPRSTLHHFAQEYAARVGAKNGGEAQ